MIAMSTIKSPWTLLLCTFCSTIEWGVKPQKLNINSGIRFCHSIHLIHHFSVCLTHLHYYVVLKHSLVSCGININRLLGTVQHYSTFPWFKSASLSVPLIRLFLVVSSHHSPAMKVRCHMSHVKINVRLTPALSYLQLSVIHGHVDVLDLVPSVLLDFIQLKTNCG